MPPRVFAALVLAAIGVLGELFVLRHLLVNCYPYKMLTYPPGRFYEQLGNAGSVAILVVITLLAIIVARKAPLLLPPVTTTLAPLFYLAMVVISTSALYGWTVPPESGNFDGYTIVQATAEFARNASGFTVAGLILGSICSGVLWSATRRS